MVQFLIGFIIGLAVGVFLMAIIIVCAEDNKNGKGNNNEKDH